MKGQDTKVVGVLGGGGFVGRYLVPLLARENYLVKVGGRHPDRYGHLKTAAAVGKIQLCLTDVRSKESLSRFIDGCDIVVDLVGVLFEKGKQTFGHIHVDAADHISMLCTHHNVQQLIYVSALGADLSSKSHYAKTKAEAEHIIQKNAKNSVIVRPSLLFGEEDQFFNRFAEMMRYFPIIPLFKNGKTLFQPLYVKDLAFGIVQIIQQHKKGEIYEFGGPEVHSFRDLFEMIMVIIKRHPMLLSMPTFMGWIMAIFSKILPNPLITMDQLKLLNTDSVCSGAHPGLKDLGISPERLDNIVPTYLRRF